MAKIRNDPPEEGPFTDLVLEWCEQDGHSYEIDTIRVSLGTSTDEKSADNGMLMSCPSCGEACIRTANRAVTCGKLESLELTMDKHWYNYIMQTLQLPIRIEMSSRAFR